MAIDAGKIRICVIGAGAAGLCAIRHLSMDLENFEPIVFEQFDDIGGTWIYGDETGIDVKNGLPIHSSMYKNLRTNIPLKLMNFPDFQHMTQSKPSCGSHEQVLNYLREYADHFQLRHYIQFRTRVESIEPILSDDDWKKTTWNVKIKNIATQIVEEKIFDAIMVCNGHYANPKVPVLEGIDTFNGDVIHSHDYRKPEKYNGKIVVILGAGPSGVDIAIELSDHAERVYLSHDKQKFISALPTNLEQVHGVKSINENKFTLKDGKIIIANTLIYCTGYWFSYPFLQDSCGIAIHDNHVNSLYKQLINIEHPKMAIIGIPSQVIPFPLFHIQVQYFLRLLKGSVDVPSKEKMLLMNENLKNHKHPHVLGDLQWEYNDSLAIAAGIDRLPVFYKNGYTKWNLKKVTNLLYYKNSEIIIESDGETVLIL